jgi:hypothetical protein
MRKRISKLVLCLGILTAACVSGVSQREAAATPPCYDYCVDPACNCVIHCWRQSGGCICEDFCQVE